MNIRTEDEHLWAAGVFDQRGKAYTKYDNQTYLVCTLAGPAVAQRFHKAIGELGAVYGPYYSNGSIQWKCQDPIQVHRAADLLNPYLTNKINASPTGLPEFMQRNWHQQHPAWTDSIDELGIVNRPD